MPKKRNRKSKKNRQTSTSTLASLPKKKLPRSSIALCMIVKNEEKWLPDCLDSVRDVVDEMVIVDTGSTDRTIEIARSYGARIYEIPWRNDFASARNVSLKHASADWILVLDADEQLDAVNRERLLKIAQSRYDGVFVRIESPVKSLNSGLVDVSIFTRFFRNRRGVCFEGIIHEQVLPSIQRTKGRIADSDLTIFHAGYAKDHEAMQAKHRRNLTLLEKQVADRPDFALGVFHLAETYQLCEQYDEALNAYHRALQLRGITTDIHAQIYQNLAYIHLHMDDPELSLDASRKALELQPDLVLPWVLTAQAYTKTAQYKETAEALEQAIRLATTPPKGGRSMLIRKIDPAYLLLFSGQTYEKLNQFSDARRAYEQAQRHRPQSLEVMLALGKLDLQEGRFKSACKWFYDALSIPADNQQALAKVIYNGLAEHLDNKRLYEVLEGMTHEADDLSIEEQPLKTLSRQISFRLNDIDRLRTVGKLSLRLKNQDITVRIYSMLPACPGASADDIVDAARALQAVNASSRAVEILETAVQQYPDHVKIRYSLGTMLLKDEKWEAAQDQLMSADHLSPATPEIEYHFALACLRNGRLHKARDILSIALTRNENQGMLNLLNLVHRMLNEHSQEEVIPVSADSRANAGVQMQVQDVRP